MLVQAYRREVLGHDAWLRRTVVRHERFRVAVMSSRNIATDFGLAMNAVTCQSQARRSQLSIVLAGRGYFSPRGRTVTLGPGDVVASDQSEQEAEGYAGAPSEVIVLEWDPEHLFAPVRCGPARFSRLSAADVEGLRRLVQEADTLPAPLWVGELCLRLRAVGLLVGSEPRPFEHRSPPSLAQAYDALGGALAQLGAQPSLTEIAGALGVSERQANRRIADLVREYGLPFDGWRTFVHESRLEWAMQVLSIPGVALSRAALLAGYRSTIALHHALSLRGASTPAAIARELSHRWR